MKKDGLEPGLGTPARTPSFAAGGIAQPSRKHHADTQAKRFATLQAQFAKHGHTLHQSGPGKGPGLVSCLAERWGLARHLPTLGDAMRLARFIASCIRLRSVSSARWLDAYDQHQPKY